MQTRGKTSKLSGPFGPDGDRENAIPSNNSPISSSLSRCSSLHVDPSKVGELAWVQCENESCLKWRIISQEEADRLQLTNESWFCSMNLDEKFNSCECPQEKLLDDKTVKKCGFRIVHGLMPVGSLVWAKMPGHIKWPAILSPDPVKSDGHYVELDHDGDPTFYHVEFLGKSHTQYWVNAHNTEIYADALKPMLRKKSGKKKMGYSTSYTATTGYHRKLTDSMTEADSLKELSTEQRLERCVFKYDKDAWSEIIRKEEKEILHHHDDAYDKPDRQFTVERKPSTQCSSRPVLPTKFRKNATFEMMPRKRRGRPPKSACLPSVPQACELTDPYVFTGTDLCQETCKKIKKTKKANKHKHKKKKKVKKHKKKKKSKHSKHAHDNKEKPSWSNHPQWRHESWKPLYAAAPLTTPPRQQTQYESAFGTGRPYTIQQQQQQQDNYMQPTLHRMQHSPLSKEHRLQADIQSLKQDEEEFLSSLAAFHKENGTAIRKSPNWQGQRISLYQLFMAVQERGGFHKVCAVLGAWKNIYQDVSNVVLRQSGSHGDTAMRYYQRNLLPYELYRINDSHLTSQPTTNPPFKNPSKQNIPDDGNASADTEPPSSGIGDTYPASSKETLPSVVPYTLKFPTLPSSVQATVTTMTSPESPPPSDGYQSNSSSFDLFSNSGQSATSEVIAPSGGLDATRVIVHDMDTAVVDDDKWKSLTG